MRNRLIEQESETNSLHFTPVLLSQLSYKKEYCFDFITTSVGVRLVSDYYYVVNLYSRLTQTALWASQ